MRISHLFYQFSIVTFALTSFLLAYILLLLWWPFNPVQVNHATVVTKQVKAGEAMLYKVDYCKYVDVYSSEYRELQSDNKNDFLIPFPAIVSVVKQGCHTATIYLLLPTYTPPGQYYLRVDASFQVNPIRTIHVLFRTDVFQVIQ